MAEEKTSVVTPASVFKNQNNKENEKYRRDIIRARAEGHAEGRSEARSDVVNFLHKKYMEPTLERGTPEADAILTVAKEVVAHLTGADLKRR